MTRALAALAAPLPRAFVVKKRARRRRVARFLPTWRTFFTKSMNSYLFIALMIVSERFTLSLL